jgi:hypothetical protein
MITTTQKETRASFYARKYGGSYRTARSEFKCEVTLCLNRITPGVRYFDTQQVTTWPKTLRICACCAEGALATPWHVGS